MHIECEEYEAAFVGNEHLPFFSSPEFVGVLIDRFTGGSESLDPNGSQIWRIDAHGVGLPFSVDDTE